MTATSESRFWRAGHGAVHQAFLSSDPAAREEWVRQATADADAAGAVIWTSSPVLQGDPRVAQFGASTLQVLGQVAALVTGRAVTLGRDGTRMFIPGVTSAAGRDLAVVIIDDPLASPDAIRCAEEIAARGRLTGVALTLAVRYRMFGSTTLRANVELHEPQDA